MHRVHLNLPVYSFDIHIREILGRVKATLADLDLEQVVQDDTQVGEGVQ